MNFSKIKVALLAMLILPLVAACSDDAERGPTPDGTIPEGSPSVSAASPAAAVSSSEADTLTVYKLATCGCCREWIAHMEADAFETVAIDSEDMSAIKEQHDIAPAYRSCHTAVSTEGYVFEGHIPARFVREFLANPPADAIGLAVPGMPLGSPGMEVEDRFTPYEVLLLKNDGSSEVFASVENAGQQ